MVTYNVSICYAAMMISAMSETSVFLSECIRMNITLNKSKKSITMNNKETFELLLADYSKSLVTIQTLGGH